jgi:ABC-type transport system substrate-binding protein
VESDPAKRAQIYSGLQKLLLEEDTVIIPLLQESIEMVVKPYINGFYIDGMEYAHLAGITVNTAYQEPKK